MPTGLRDQIIGAWKLISYEERPVDGSSAFHPMSEKPMGIIMYTSDGFMSAQLPEARPEAFCIGGLVQWHGRGIQGRSLNLHRLFRSFPCGRGEENAYALHVRVVVPELARADAAASGPDRG